MANPTILVQPPTRKPRKGGISTVADFRSDSRLATGALPNYDALPCNLVVADIELCYSPNPAATDKVGDGIDVTDAIGPTFGGYVGVECFSGPWDDYAERARLTFEQSKDRLIEAKLGVWLATATNTASTSYAAAIGVLEEGLDSTYPGLGIIHMSRQDAVAAAAEYAIFADDTYDGRVWTVNGTPVLVSGSYATGFVYSSGGITVLESELVVRQALDLPHNLSLAIAEGAFNILVDCGFAHKATVTP